MKKAWMLLLLTAFLMTDSVIAAQYRIAYAIPRTVDDMFFGPTFALMQAAAHSLDVELEVLESAGNHLATVRQIREAITRKDNPVDAVIALSAKENGVQIVTLCESAKVPLLIENAGIINPLVGSPREKYRFYIGELLPDDKLAGYLLGKYLISLQQERAPNATVNIVGINGPLGNGPAQARFDGLNQAITETSNTHLLQVVRARWEPETARSMFRGLKTRYAQDGINVVWAASDGMALGARSVLPLDDTTTLFGGIDWSAEGVKALESGTLKATAGGHLFEAAWALILMFDYLNGHDFAPDHGVHLRSEMVLMTEQNRTHYLPLLDPSNWDKIDFRQFSKHYNSSLSKHHFSLEPVIEMISAK